MMSWKTFGFQDAISPIMEEFSFFHDFANIVLIFIISSIGLVLLKLVMNKRFIDKTLNENQWVEVIWTVSPTILLVQMAVPSLFLLYLMDESCDSQMTVKSVGRQWYWSYEYSDFWSTKGDIILGFDSYMVPLEESSADLLRLLDADNRMVVPFNVHFRLLISSGDVLHSWAVPSLGLKADASPGRLNQLKFVGHRPGVYFGQCSEICGANHSFMPIVVELISPIEFIDWILAAMTDEDYYV